MRTPKHQDSDNVLTKTTEVRMKHYDKGEDYNQQVIDQHNLVAKEASFIQACGYVPTLSLSEKDWDEMVARDKRIYDGKYYRYDPTDVYRGEQHHPRYV